MKRIQMCKKVNRNNNSFNHLRTKVSNQNIVSPQIHVGHIWLQDEPTAVEMIELHTSDEFDPPPDEAQSDRLDHPWSYVDRLQHIEDNYKINKKARERRRMKYENDLLTRNVSTNTNHHSTNNVNSCIEGNHIDDSKLTSHQVNCFTIVNKHFINSDTSSDGEFADVEILASNDTIRGPNNGENRNNHYDEEIITHDPVLDKGTRTIWIYSFKNKHLLREDELVDIPSVETSSCSTSRSMESDEDQPKDKNINVSRIGSPIPVTYIPKLNFSLVPTLSTVTEVSEPNRPPSSNGSDKSSKNKFQKPNNSWFIIDTEKLDSERSLRKLEKSTNIINWIALSPREKRRRSKEQGDKWEGSLLKLETPHTEKILENNEQLANESGNDNSLRLQVDVDVHVSVNEKSPGKRSLGTPISANVNLKSNTDKISPKKIKHAKADIKEYAKDRGDHQMSYDMRFEQTQQILCLTNLNNSNLSHMIVNEQPVKKLSSAEWNLETQIEKETGTYDFLTNKMKLVNDSENTVDNLWMRNNIPLLKPSQWNEYLPIAESPYSLHLSLGSIVEERQPWYKRFMNCMSCCK